MLSVPSVNKLNLTVFPIILSDLVLDFHKYCDKRSLLPDYSNSNLEYIYLDVTRGIVNLPPLEVELLG